MAHEAPQPLAPPDGRWPLSPEGKVWYDAGKREHGDAFVLRVGAWRALQPGQASRPAPLTWAEIHRRPAAMVDVEEERKWLDRTPRMLGLDCSCLNHWREYLTENPPDLSSAEAYFAWTVDAHNAVNRRLGKPELSLTEARVIWGEGRGEGDVTEGESPSRTS